MKTRTQQNPAQQNKAKAQTKYRYGARTAKNVSEAPLSDKIDKLFLSAAGKLIDLAKLCQWP